MTKIFEALGQIGLVPVITINREEDAVPLARALLDGGVGCAEITFRTAAAAGARRKIHGELPQTLIGGGTVRTTEERRRDHPAGGHYMVLPDDQPADLD